MDSFNFEDMKNNLDEQVRDQSKEEDEFGNCYLNTLKLKQTHFFSFNRCSEIFGPNSG